MPGCGKLFLIGATAAMGCSAAWACTSWIIHSSVSRSGMMMVQKSRDSFAGPLSADIRTSEGVRWMRIGTTSPYATFAVSEKGIAAINNDGDDVTLKHPGKKHLGIANGFMLRQIVTGCADAREGAELLREYGRNALRIGRGGTFLVADPKRAFLVDIAPGYAEVMEQTGGVVVISNTWHLPGGEAFSRKGVGSITSDRSREANTRAALKKEQVDGKYTPRGTVNVSRMVCGTTPATRFPYRYTPGKPVSSLGGACFELDPEFPAQLTTAYLTMGPQRHTICLPTPMALRQFPEKIRSGKWAADVLKFREKVGNSYPGLKEIRALEDRLFPEYESIRDEARRLLRAGKRDEAVKLLNDCYERQFKAADELMTRLIEQAK